MVHNFRGFSLWLLGLIAFEPVARQNVIMGAHGRDLMEAKKQREGEEGEELPMSLLRAHPQ